MLQATGDRRGEYRRIGISNIRPSHHFGNLPNLDDMWFTGHRVLETLFSGQDEPRELLDDLLSKMPELAREERDSKFPDKPFVIDII